MGVCPMRPPLGPSITRSRPIKANPSRGGGAKPEASPRTVEVAQLPDQLQPGGTTSRMAELNIVFRLRFAVALTAAFSLLLVFSASKACGGATSTSSRWTGAHPREGEADRPGAGRPRDPPSCAVINGFGAVLEDDAAEELETNAAVKDVSLNAATAGRGGDRHERRLQLPDHQRDDDGGQSRADGRLGLRRPLQNVSSGCDQPFSARSAPTDAWQRATGAASAWR